MAAKKTSADESNTKIYLFFTEDMTSTPQWIARAFSLYRATHEKNFDKMPTIPSTIDLCDVMSVDRTGATKPRYRVVAATSPPETWNKKSFVETLMAQKNKGKGALRKQPLDQIYLIRDNTTSDLFLCTPAVFLQEHDSKTTSAKSKPTNIMRVFSTEEGMRLVAMARREYLISLQTANSDQKVKKPELKTIIQSMIAIAKRPDKDSPTVDFVQKENGEERISKLRDYSIQVGKNIWMPVCGSAFLHKTQPDVSTPFDEEEALRPPAPKRRSQPRAESKAARSDDDEDDEDMGRVQKRSRKKTAAPSEDDEEDEDDMGGSATKRQRKQKPAKEEKKAKRGNELASIGALVDDDSDGEHTDVEQEVVAEPSDDCLAALGRSIKQLGKLIPADAQAGAPVELHRAIMAELHDNIESISEEARSALCAHLGVTDYDNSEHVRESPDNNLSVLRKKTGVPKDIMLPAWSWPLLLFFNQHTDADINAYIKAAPGAIARASRDWAVQTTRPLTSEQMPKDWAPLFNAKLCEQMVMLGHFEQHLVSVMRKQVAETASSARDVVLKCRELQETVATQSTRITDLQRDLAEADAREQELVAKLAEAEARAATKKLPPLPAIAKKAAPVEDDNTF